MDRFIETITTHEAKTHLSRYLAAIERGEEFTIARGKKPIAMLMTAIPNIGRRSRPRVGESLDAPMSFPESAFAPLSSDELKDWLK